MHLFFVSINLMSFTLGNKTINVFQMLPPLCNDKVFLLGLTSDKCLNYIKWETYGKALERSISTPLKHIEISPSFFWEL